MTLQGQRLNEFLSNIKVKEEEDGGLEGGKKSVILYSFAIKFFWRETSHTSNFTYYKNKFEKNTLSLQQVVQTLPLPGGALTKYLY